MTTAHYGERQPSREDGLLVGLRDHAGIGHHGHIGERVGSIVPRRRGVWTSRNHEAVSGRWGYRRCGTGWPRRRPRSCWNRYSRRTFCRARMGFGRSGRPHRRWSGFASASSTGSLMSWSSTSPISSARSTTTVCSLRSRHRNPGPDHVLSRVPSGGTSAGRISAVDDVLRTGYVGGGVTCQEQDEASDLASISHSAQRNDFGQWV